jgi:glycosyltransferase involved in cell wall biosynthesis
LQSIQKIKICHLSSVHKATDTRIFYRECRSLASEYDVTLIAQSSASYNKDNVKIIRLKQPKNRLERFLITDLFVFFKALKVNAKLYHIHDPELIVFALILKLFGKKIIYDLHEDVVADLEHKKWLNVKPFVKSIYIFFENLALPYFHLVLAEGVYANTYKNRTAKYIVVQNFVQLKDFESTTDIYNSGSNSLAFVGYLSARRGLPYMLEALSILKNRGLLINLRCIGELDIEVEEILKNSHAWLEIKNQVEFKGYIPFPQSILDIQDCIAGLALPESIPNHQHSYPTKMFEYMAIGLPVIASNFQLYIDVIDKYDCGLTVIPEDPLAIANAIEIVYLDKEIAKKMSENAKKAVKNFDWETEAKKLLDFYKQILNQN